MHENELIKLSQNRFKVMEEIERYEARFETLETRWEKLNSIRQTAIDLGITPVEDADTQVVRNRWLKLKRDYASF